MTLATPQHHSGFDVEVFLGIGGMNNLLHAAFHAADADRKTLFTLPAAKDLSDPHNRILLLEPNITSLTALGPATAELELSLPVEFRNFDPPPAQLESPLLRLLASRELRAVVSPATAARRTDSLAVANARVARAVVPARTSQMSTAGRVPAGAKAPTPPPPHAVRKTLELTVKAHLEAGGLRLTCTGRPFSKTSRNWLDAADGGVALIGIPGLSTVVGGMLAHLVDWRLALPNQLRQAVFLAGSTKTEACLAVGINLDSLLLKGFVVPPEMVPPEAVTYSAVAIPVPLRDPVTKAYNYNKDAPWGPSVSFGMKAKGRLLSAAGLNQIYDQTPLAARFPRPRFAIESAGTGILMLRNTATGHPVSGYEVERVIEQWAARGRSDRLVNQLAKVPGRQRDALIRLSDQTRLRLRHHLLNAMVPNNPVARVRPTRPVQTGSTDLTGQYTDLTLEYTDQGLNGRVSGSLRYADAVNASFSAPFSLRIALGEVKLPKVDVGNVETDLEYLPDALTEALLYIFGFFEILFTSWDFARLDDYNLGLQRSLASNAAEQTANEGLNRQIGLIPQQVAVGESRHHKPYLRRLHVIRFAVESISAVAGNLAISIGSSTGSHTIADLEGSFAGISGVPQQRTGNLAVMDKILLNWRNRDGLISTFDIETCEDLLTRGLLPRTAMEVSGITWVGGVATAITVRSARGDQAVLNPFQTWFLTEHLPLILIPGIGTEPGSTLQVESALAARFPRRPG